MPRRSSSMSMASAFTLGDDHARVVRQARGAARAGHVARSGIALRRPSSRRSRSAPRRVALGPALDPRELRGHAHADDRRQVLGARAIAALLRAPDDQRRELRRSAAPIVRPPRAGRRGRSTTARAGRCRTRRRSSPSRPTAPTPSTWNATPRCRSEAADLRDRLDGADLQIGRLDRHEDGVVGERPGRRRRDRRARRRRRPRSVTVPSALLELAAGVEHRHVLGHGRDDVAAVRARGESLDGEVVGLGGGRREDHAGRRAADETRDLGARAVERGARLEAERMGGRRIAGAALRGRAA